MAGARGRVIQLCKIILKDDKDVALGVCDPEHVIKLIFNVIQKQNCDNLGNFITNIFPKNSVISRFRLEKQWLHLNTTQHP